MKKRESKFTPKLLGLAIASMVHGAVAQDAPSSAVDDASLVGLEEVVVTGIRQSIATSTKIKQDADNVVDVITAEDIGKFPDNNVMEALQRITGVQIGRDEAGDATGFTIRGISQNRVEINGRSPTAGEGEGRNPQLGDIPAELLAGLEVIKSPTADMTEGSLGGTVNLKTAKPFDFKKPKRTVNVRAKYGDNIDEFYGNYSGLFSHTWNDSPIGRFGVLLNASHNTNKVAGDGFKLNGWATRCQSYALTRPDGTTLRGNGRVEDNCNNIANNIPGAEPQYIYGPNQAVLLQYEEERTRTAINTTLQWEPTENSSYVLDVTYMEKEDLQNRDTLQIGFHQGRDFMDAAIFDGLPDGTVINAYQNVVLAGDVPFNDDLGEPLDPDAPFVNPIVSADISNAYINGTNGQGQTLETDRISLALSGEWDFDTLQASAEISYSASEHERHYFAHNLARWGGNISNQQNQTLRVDDGEAIRVSGQNASLDFSDSRLGGVDWQGHSLTDPRYFRLNAVQDDGWRHKPKEIAAKFDFDYDLDFKDITTIEFGARFTENTMERDQRFRFRCVRNNAFGGNGPNGNSFADGDPSCEDPSVSAVDLLASNPEAFKEVDGYFDQESVVNPGVWLQLDPELRLNREGHWQNLYGFNEVGGFTYSPFEEYTITEKTSAAYLKANFDGELGGGWAYRGNAGVRAVQTDAEFETFAGPADHDYFQVLPSANVAFAYGDGNIVRLAAAKVMVRPTFDQLKPTGSFNNFSGCRAYDERDPFNDQNLAFPDPNLPQAQQDAQQAQLDALDQWESGSLNPCPGIRTAGTNIGNPELDPYTAYNYDLSFEKYWGEGNSASIAFFYRDVQADIVRQRGILEAQVSTENQIEGTATDGVEYWTIRNNQNSTGSVREGVELAFTQFMDFLPSPFDGVGVSANYTYVEGTRPDAVFVLEDGSRVDADGQAVTRETEGAQLLEEESFKPVRDLSKESYNASVFYEKYDLSLRLSYNYRDGFFQNSNRYRDSSDRLDFASSYKFSKNLNMNFNVQNILRESRHFYDRDRSITRETGYTDVVYTLGISYKFK